MVVVFMSLHMPVKLWLRNITLYITPYTFSRLFTIGKVAYEWFAVRMDPQLVDLQIRLPNKSFLTSQHIALELLIDLHLMHHSTSHLMMALDVEFQPTGCWILLRAAGVRTHVRLDMTLVHSPHVGRALVNLHVLFEMLLIIELFAAIRFGTHEVAGPVHLVRAHVHVQIALPVEYPNHAIRIIILLVASGVGAFVLWCATRKERRVWRPVRRDNRLRCDWVWFGR